MNIKKFTADVDEVAFWFICAAYTVRDDVGMSDFFDHVSICLAHDRQRAWVVVEQHNLVRCYIARLLGVLQQSYTRYPGIFAAELFVGESSVGKETLALSAKIHS